MKVVLRVLEGPDRGRVFELEGRQNFLAGRDPDAHLCVAGDGTFSKRHFMLEVDPPRVHVRDLGSKSGTLVNGEPVTEAPLRHGDEITGGVTVLRVEVEGGDDTALASADRTQQGFAASSPSSEVRCECGAPAPHSPARAAAEDVTYLCERCHERKIANPILPDGHELVRILGRGAMGCVYLVRHADGLRALKQILPRVAMSADRRKHFLREAKVQSALQHPNIVRAFDLHESQPGVFSMVMEYVEGVSGDRLIAAGPLDPGRAVEIACQALAGLAHAHARDIVHRDVKDANLLVAQTTSGIVVKVADFGLAKNYQQSGMSGFTSDGEVGGTSAYMPKEQLIDYLHAQPVSDVFALGATLYRLLTGAYPRDFQRDVHWVQTVLNGRIVPVSERAPGLSAKLAAVVDKALAADANDRWRTAEEMRAALRRAV